jgi:hypothetical protein
MKPTNTALYELMGGDGVEHPPKTPDEQPPPRSWRSSAGRTIRVPVGYLWLAGAGGLVFLIGAFSTGYVRGQHEATTKLEREWSQTRQPALAVPPPEIQLTERTVGTERSAARQRGAVTTPPGQSPSRAQSKSQARSKTALTGDDLVLSDPRKEGFNYFILIHTHRDNAVELAIFCRQEGVEAYAVPDKKNRSLWRVLVLPGYTKGQRSSEPVRALEQRIAAATRKWKLQRNPRDELGYYPERFGG